MEPDFHQQIGRTAIVSTTRIFLEEVTREEELRMLDNDLPKAIELIRTTAPDVVIFGCTSAGALGTLAHDCEIGERIRKGAGAPAVTVLEKMSLMEKLAFVKEVYMIPKAIAAEIENINAIRNALAHAFFPENLRAYRTKHGSASRKLAGPHYKGIDIFTVDGIDRFLDGSRRVVQFLIVDARRKKRGRSSSSEPRPAPVL